MQELGSHVVPAAIHFRWSIFDWSLANIIVGAVLIVVFFLAAWARLPRWIERGREKERRNRQ